MQKPLLKLLCLSLCALALEACVTVSSTHICTVAGQLAAGAICAETLSDHTSSLTVDEYIEFLEPQAERPDPAHPGHTLPARAGAMCQSASDWNLNKTALEQACRELGSKCSYDAKKAIEHLNTPLAIPARAP